MEWSVKLVFYFAGGLVLLLLLSTPASSQGNGGSEDERKRLAIDCNNCMAQGNCSCTKVGTTGFSFSNVASRSLSLNWERTEIASIVGYAVVYGVDGEEFQAKLINLQTATTTVLTALRPFTNYTAWIRPMCSEGFALCSTPLQFRTKGEPPSGTPQNVKVSMIRDGLKVTWNHPPLETWNGDLTSYVVFITNLDTSNITEYMEPATNTAYVIGDLNPGHYALRISAVNEYGRGPETETPANFEITQAVDESDDFDFWDSNYRYLIIPVVIVIGVLVVVILLYIKWKYYPSTVLYCKDIVEKQHSHVYADQHSPTAVATEFSSFTSPFQHTQLYTQSVSSNSEENSHSTVPASAQRVLNVSPPSHRAPNNGSVPCRDAVSPNDNDSVFGPYAEVGLQKHCSPGVQFPPVPNMSRHPSLWPHKKNRMGIGRANSTAGDTPTLPAHAVGLSSQPSPYEVPHSVTDPAESLTLSDPSINQDDFSPPGRSHPIPYSPQQPAAVNMTSRNNISAQNIRMQSSMASMHSTTSTVPPPMLRHNESHDPLPIVQSTPQAIGQKHITQSQTSMASIPPVPFHSPPPLTKSSLNLVARLEKGHESIEDLMETIEQEEREAGMVLGTNRLPNGPRLLTSASHTAVPFYSEPFSNTKAPSNDVDPSWLQPGARDSNSLPRFTRMNSVPNYLAEDTRKGQGHHKVSVPNNAMLAGATPPIHPRSNINRFPSTRSEQPLPYLKEWRHNHQDNFAEPDEL